MDFSQGDALAIRRLLWDLAPEARHDLQVEAYHWAAKLETLAGLPPWPKEGENAELVAFYKSILARLSTTIASLQRAPE